MNRILSEVCKIAKDSLKEYLPEVDPSQLEENGKIYYMNAQNGSNFDFFANEHFSAFMSFYDDEANMGAMKALLYRNGQLFVYVFKNRASSPFKEVKTKIEASEREMLELAVIMEKEENKGKFGFSVEDMDSDASVSDEEIKEFIERNEE